MPASGAPSDSAARCAAPRTSRGLARPFLAAAAASLGPHVREQDHVADRGRAGEQHRQAVDAHAAAAGRRQSVAEGANIVLVHAVRLEVAPLALFPLLEEALALLERVVE